MNNIQEGKTETAASTAYKIQKSFLFFLATFQDNESAHQSISGCFSIIFTIHKLTKVVIAHPIIIDIQPSVFAPCATSRGSVRTPNPT